MVQPVEFMDYIKLYFAHIFWLGVLLVFMYSYYVDNFKIKKEGEYLSDTELMERFAFAVKKGMIKIDRRKNAVKNTTNINNSSTSRHEAS